jgi:sensor domain CHASE-containing protein
MYDLSEISQNVVAILVVSVGLLMGILKIVLKDWKTKLDKSATTDQVEEIQKRMEDGYSKLDAKIEKNFSMLLDKILDIKK